MFQERKLPKKTTHPSHVCSALGPGDTSVQLTSSHLEALLALLGVDDFEVVDLIIVCFFFDPWDLQGTYKGPTKDLQRTYKGLTNLQGKRSLLLRGSKRVAPWRF